MSKVPDFALIAGLAGGVVIIVALVLYFLRSRTINLSRSESPDEKPEWMRSTPQPETVAATQAAQIVEGLLDNQQLGTVQMINGE